MILFVIGVCRKLFRRCLPSAHNRDVLCVSHLDRSTNWVYSHNHGRCFCVDFLRGLFRNVRSRDGRPAFARQLTNVRFSNRPFGVKRFQTIHHYSVDVAHGLVLLFGIGTRGPSTMGFEDEVEQSFGRPCHQLNGRSKRTCELASSVVPRGTSFHRSVELEYPPVESIGSDLAELSCYCSSLLPGPVELGAVNPDAVHDNGQSARQRHDRLLHPAAPGDLHRPGLEP